MVNLSVFLCVLCVCTVENLNFVPTSDRKLAALLTDPHRSIGEACGLALWRQLFGHCTQLAYSSGIWSMKVLDSCPTLFGCRYPSLPRLNFFN